MNLKAIIIVLCRYSDICFKYKIKGNTIFITIKNCFKENKLLSIRDKEKI